MLSTVHKNKNSHPKDGFALVISLSLMAFVLLLILSISTLVQVEISSAQINQKRLEAELNAYLGMQMALGELQKTLGPDQRVSATAGLLPDTKAGRSNIVGVWASADQASLGQKEGDLITWLASDAGGSGDNFKSDYATQEVASSGVILVGAGSVAGKDLNDLNDIADDITEQIVVDLATSVIEEDGRTVGNYAWWIGDEGTKARINLDREPAKSKQQAVLEAGSTSIANAAGLEGLAEVRFGEETERLSELKDLVLLSDIDASTANKYFHDLTTWSHGVLADVKNGGLKKDLSLAFEMSDDRFNASEFAAGGASTINAPGFGRVQPVFTLENTTGSDAHGPVWHLLRDYYRLYHAMEKPMTDPTLAARVFGPNVNHGEPSLALGSELTNSPAALDKQPAILFAGGKAKFFNQSYLALGSYGPLSPLANGKRGPSAFADEDKNSNSLLRFQMTKNDPLRLGLNGDPLRGGGLTTTTEGTTIMPVMLTGNYMPYLMRFVAEMGIWFENTNGKDDGKEYVKLNEMTRETFVLHNPYNVTIRHDEIGVDCFGFDISYRLKKYDESALPVSGNRLYRWGDGELVSNTIQNESERQIRVEMGSFEPGEILTYSANNYGKDPTDKVEYADNGTNPEWHHYKFARKNNTRESFYFELPAKFDPDVDVGIEEGYFLNIYGSPFNLQAEADLNGNYSISSIFLATHLQPRPDSPFDGIFLRDTWPLASVVDTALLLPGHNGNGPPPASGSRYKCVELPITWDFIEQHKSPENGVYPTATFDFQLKPAEYSKLDVRYPAFARSNPLAPVRDNKNLLPADDFINEITKGGFPKLAPDTDVVMQTGGAQSLTQFYNLWGPSDGVMSGGVTNPVMIELPTSPVLSLGKLQHANISIHAHMPALAIGNSLASVYIPKNQVFTTFKNYYGQERIFYDLSYLMNEALWDSYYFSSYSLPYDAGRDDYDESGSSVSEMFDAVASGTQTLPNPRMKLLADSREDVPALRTKLFEGDDSIKVTAPVRAAENLLVEGSFNVNSSSVDAWRAVLSGARDSAIYQSGKAEESPLTPKNTQFSRFTQPVAGEFTGSSVSDGDKWAGFRSLNDDEIESLATEIVAEIGNRVASTSPEPRPYLSLSDFVNRELTNIDFGRTGVIQAAIDRAGLNRSENVSSPDSAISKDSLDNGNFPEPENILLADGSPGSASMSAPTYLMQADVLQAIGSFISVRSDTFRIRSYGQSLDPLNQQVLAKVWYEAIVQRIPEPVNPSSDTPKDPDYWTALDANGDPQPFGRRFKVLSIRQLSEDEV